MSTRIAPLKYSDLFTPIAGVDEYRDAAMLGKGRVQAAESVWAKDGSLYKRPGRRLWGPEFDTNYTFRGVKEYVDADGNVRLLVAHGRKLYSVTASTATELDDYNDDQDIHFTAAAGRCFYNGTTAQRKIVGATASAVGIAAPASAPGLSAGAAGVLTGSYAYRVTYVIEVDGVRESESDPSTVSNSVTLAGEQGALADVPVSADSRVNARYIYRTTAGGARYYYVGKISDNTTTTYSDNVADASIGAEVEYTHGVPTQSPYSCICNERQYWLDGNMLRYSEAATTVAYYEYAKSTNFWRLPGTGDGVGLAALYNPNTGRQDLYVFQDDAIAVLPAGDPKTALIVLRHGMGGYHDTIATYNGMLIFLSTTGIVCALSQGQIIDLSTRNIPVSMEGMLNKSGNRAAMIFDHYYALTIEYDAGKLYNHRTWLLDLRTLQAQGGAADAVWFPWTVDADYWIQRKDGTVLALDNNSKRIYQYGTSYTTDETTAAVYANISAWIRTPNFMFNRPMSIKAPRVLSLHGTFQKALTITPYSWRTNAETPVTYTPIDTAFIVGASVMGAPTTKVKRLQEATMPMAVTGNVFSFKIASTYDDGFFELVAYQFTYQEFLRGL